MWQFESEVGQPDGSTEINAEIFDAFAVKMLNAMKKDGIVGG